MSTDYVRTHLIGQSRAMAALHERIHRIARSHIPIVIIGETGTGKEVCADAIAHLSGQRPYVPVNCGALAEGLVESELFGHEKGAFTGAIRSRQGLLERADGGILFLDELADMPLTIQFKLLRALELGEYTRVGGDAVRHAKIRLLAAINREPEAVAAVGQLREDMMYRLGAMRVRLPPLRNRLEDIRLLVPRFVARYREQAKITASITIDESVYPVLMAHSWPGNIRQLRSVVDSALVLSGSVMRLTAGHVREVLDDFGEPPPTRLPPSVLAHGMREREAQIIRAALEAAGGSRRVAARALGISQATLFRKLQRLGITNSQE